MPANLPSDLPPPPNIVIDLPPPQDLPPPPPADEDLPSYLPPRVASFGKLGPLSHTPEKGYAKKKDILYIFFIIFVGYFFFCVFMLQ